MSYQNTSVGIFNTHIQSEVAVKALQTSGLNIKKLSIVGKDPYSDEQLLGFYNTGDRMEYWGRSGKFWDGLWDLLSGAGFFWVPGIGPLLVAGPLVALIVDAVEGSVVVGDPSAIGTGLLRMGIPKDSVLKYETFIKNGKFILIYNGNIEEAEKAHQIFERSKAEEANLHPCGRTLPS
jgi:hypothetical protein